MQQVYKLKCYDGKEYRLKKETADKIKTYLMTAEKGSFIKLADDFVSISNIKGLFLENEVSYKPIEEGDLWQ